MKKKIAVTLVLAAASAAAVVLAYRTYGVVNSKLNLQYKTQNTMEIAKGVVPEDETKVTESEVEVLEALETPVTEEQEEVNPEAPVLTLVSERVEIIMGSSFEATFQVADITDDKDDRSSLFRDIRVVGEYDINTPGEYTLTYIVMDSDGNQSIPKELKLVVKAQ